MRFWRDGKAAHVSPDAMLAVHAVPGSGHLLRVAMTQGRPGEMLVRVTDPGRYELLVADRQMGTATMIVAVPASADPQAECALVLDFPLSAGAGHSLGYRCPSTGSSDRTS